MGRRSTGAAAPPQRWLHARGGGCACGGCCWHRTASPATSAGGADETGGVLAAMQKFALELATAPRLVERRITEGQMGGEQLTSTQARLVGRRRRREPLRRRRSDVSRL